MPSETPLPLDRFDAERAALEADDRPTARLFLTALGLVHLLVWASLAVQARLLVGRDGLLPVAEFLGARRAGGPARFLRFPTLFWLCRPPPVVAPHQPRVDFQLWFFTLGRDGGAHDYNTLIRRLCTRPESVRRLFREPSLPREPPLAIRVAYYRYRMTDLATRERDGRYWSRQLLDYHPVAYFCDATKPLRF